MRYVARLLLLQIFVVLTSCAPLPAGEVAGAASNGEEGVRVSTPAGQDTVAQRLIAPTLPPSGDDALEHLASSPRHAEWQMIDAGGGDSVRVWLVYPEAAEPAPVVVVVHEIFGLTPWIRAVADQLAADGFIAVAPDFLSGEDVPWDAHGPLAEAARAAIANVAPADVQRRIDAAARWAMELPAAASSYAVVGFCWGGTVAFEHAARSSGSPAFSTSVVYYGTSPAPEQLARIQAPILGLYGENDARVNVTIERAHTILAARGSVFDSEIYAGAGHGFLRAQSGQAGANLSAARQAWPRTIRWLRDRMLPTDGGGLSAQEPSRSDPTRDGYRATGNEPFWMISLDESRMNFHALGDEDTVSVERPIAEVLRDGWRFSSFLDGKPFTMRIEERYCTDTMSGRPFPHTVTVTVFGETYHGCGGDTASLLTGAEWVVHRLSGAETVGIQRPTLHFSADGTLTGSGGCNRHHGTYRITGEGIRLGPVAATRMACANEEMNAQETRFFKLLEEVRTFAIAEDGSLELMANDRPVMVARR